MAELIAKTPCAGQGLPVAQGGAELAEWLPGRMTSVAPFAGQELAANRALAALDLVFPAPNAMATAGDACIVWTGRGQAFLIGAAPPAGLAEAAALTDQSDGWAALRLAGPAAADVLARLVPLDLSAPAFPPGTAARSLLGHMSVVLMRPEPQTWQLLVFRSMARTAVHELQAAMTSLAGRAALRA
ncbi:MAG: sarcosine oxidase subunit gamma [Gemmobacter sp.]|uniref:sarcosine oxidase subunit gamma n=1 Tax=Gemmobacter sp. TaxID=1898957 RepID=UPI00391D55A1